MLKVPIRRVFKKLEEVIEFLKVIFEKQKEMLTNTYNQYECSRLIYGRQFAIIFNYLNGSKNKKIIKYINKYLTNNKINEENQNYVISIDFESKDKLKTMYEYVPLYIQNLYIKNNLSVEQIFAESKIIKKDYKGLYSYLTVLDQLEKDTILIYNNLTKHFPISQTVLFCNDETSTEEIISFLYRAIKCKQNILFTIIKCEALNKDNGNLILNLLSDLYIEKTQLNSMILFVYADKNSNLIQQITKKDGHKHFRFNESLKKSELLLNDSNEIKVYFAEVSGLGKSKMIQKEFETKYKYKGYKYYYFPIGGDINRNDLLKRLKDLNEYKYFFHLDLLDTNKINLIREFLFLFLITKSFTLNDDIFYYGDNFKIKIEVSNSFDNYLSKFPILTFLKKEMIKKNNLAPFDISSKDILDNEQIVSNYLKMLKENKINEFNLLLKIILQN